MRAEDSFRALAEAGPPTPPRGILEELLQWSSSFKKPHAEVYVDDVDVDDVVLLLAGAAPMEKCRDGDSGAPSSISLQTNTA